VLVETFWKILATLSLVVINGFFVAAEFAAVGARASHIDANIEQSVLARLARM
jgi:CBS domain containing-hemolysin-like protein